MSQDVHYSDSPFLKFLGTSLEEWRDGYTRISLVLRPHHLNRSGVVHGGVLATLLDHAGGLAGMWCSVPGNRRYGVTLSLTSNYLAQTRTGRLISIGERISSGRRIYYSRIEVRADEGGLLATGSGVYRYRTGSESPEGVPPRTPPPAPA